jgi:RsiW-degrading membrane proteinase PrsW (M82 family)
MDQALLVIPISVLATAIPTAFYVGIVWWLDRYEKEPVWLLAGAFLWGAVPAVVASLIAELVAGVPTGLLGGALASTIDSSLSAPVIEEVVKGAAVVVIFLAFRSEFDDVLDGIVYGAMVGLGFAMTENVLYFISAYSTGGPANWGMVVFLRSVVFGLNHALYTSVTGAGLGLARYYRGAIPRVAVQVAALFLAISLHGIHNLFVELNDLVCGAVLVSALSDWGGILVVFLVAAAFWQKEKSWIASELAEEVRLGTVTAGEYQAAQSTWRRTGARWDALTKHGFGAYRRAGLGYQLLTELSFKKRQARLMGDENGDLAEVQRLRGQIARLRFDSDGRTAPTAKRG